MSQGKQLTDKQVEEYKALYLLYLETYNGLTALVQKHLMKDFPDIDIRWDYYQKMWRREDEFFQIKVTAVKKCVTANVENKLFKLISEDNLGAIKLYLERRAGWTEKTETTVTNDTPVKLTIIQPDMKSLDSKPYNEPKELEEPDETD